MRRGALGRYHKGRDQFWMIPQEWLAIRTPYERQTYHRATLRCIQTWGNDSVLNIRTWSSTHCCEGGQGGQEGREHTCIEIQVGRLKNSGQLIVGFIRWQKKGGGSRGIETWTRGRSQSQKGSWVWEDVKVKTALRRSSNETTEVIRKADDEKKLYHWCLRMSTASSKCCISIWIQPPRRLW